MAKIVEARGHARLTAHGRKIVRGGMCRYAEEFYRTALKTGSPLIRWYLLGHAVELFLKVYLLHRGLTIRTLASKDFGHNLHRLLIESINQGIEREVRISPELRSDLTNFSALYSSKGLEYFSGLFILVPPQLPPMRRIQRFAATLNAKARQYV